MVTGRAAYRRVFDFWLKIFGVAFGMGVVSGIVLAFEFGTNWSELSRLSGPIQGPLLSYETFTAFMLEASFFGVLLFRRSRVRPGFYLFSTAMVALGTTLSAFWIMVNNSWMQHPVGYEMLDGQYAPTDWSAIVFSPVLWVRFPHMLFAAYLTGAFCVAATGAWYALRGLYHAEARIMVRMGLALASIVIPAQLLFGHLVGDYVHHYQPVKFAAIEARWHDEQPAAEVLIAWPDEHGEANRYAVSVPVLGSLIASLTLDSKEPGLTDFPRGERPPIGITFFAFRVMVGCAMIMLLVAWGGSLLAWKERLMRNRPLLWAVFCCFPLPFRRHADRLVHPPKWAASRDRLWPAAYRRRRDAVPHHACGRVVAGDLLRGHMCSSSRSASITSTSCCARGRPSSCRRTRRMRCRIVRCRLPGRVGQPDAAQAAAAARISLEESAK